MKIKLTPVGIFEKSIYIYYVVEIIKIMQNEIRIDFVDKDGVKKSKIFNLKKWSVILYDD